MLFCIWVSVHTVPSGKCPNFQITNSLSGTHWPRVVVVMGLIAEAHAAIVHVDVPRAARVVSVSSRRRVDVGLHTGEALVAEPGG